MNLYFRLATLYLWRRKLRSFLTTLAVVFGVMIIFGLNGISPALETSFRHGMAASSLKLPLVVTTESRGLLNDDLVPVVQGVPGVTGVSGFLDRVLYLPASHAVTSENGQRITALAIHGLNPAAGGWLFDVVRAEGRELVAGRLLAPGDGDRVVISETLSRGMGLGVGDKLQLPTASGNASYEIVGILSGRGLSIAAEKVFMPLEAAQKLYNVPGQINGIAARFIPGADEESVRREVEVALGPGYQLGALDAGAEAWDAIFQLAGLVFTTFGILALSMAGLIMFNSFRTLVMERRRDIGLLRAVGAKRSTVTGLILTEGLVQGMAGTAAGIAAGYLLAHGLLAFLAPIWAQFLHTPLGEPSFTLATWAQAVILGMAVPILSGWLPARSAGRVPPLEALRPSIAEVKGRATGKGAILGAVLVLLALLGLTLRDAGLSSLGVVLFLVGLALLGPALVNPVARLFAPLLAPFFRREIPLARGNLDRQPERAAITASTVTLGLAILVALAGLATTVTGGMIGYLDKSLRADYLLVPDSIVFTDDTVGAAPELAQSIRDIPGVAELTTLRRGKTQAQGIGSVVVIGVDPVTYSRLGGMTFTSGDPEQGYALLDQGRYAIVNGVFAMQSGAKVGQEILLDTAEGPRSYRVAGVGVEYMSAKLAAVYISHSNLEVDFHEGNDAMIMANLKPDADRAQVEPALSKLVEKYPQFLLLSLDEFRETQLAGTDALGFSLYLLVSILAVPSLLALANTLGINVLERTREIGLLRAIGATRGQVQRMILAESLLLTAVGALFGIGAGVWLGYALVAAMGVFGIPMPYYFPWSGIITALAVGLLFGILAAWLPSRRAASLNIPQALAYE